MPSTSVHFPRPLLLDLDHLAAEQGLSRNRLIIEACRETLCKRREWPSEFFSDARFRAEDLEELRASSRDFEEDLAAARCSRDAPPF
jgi:hypothetical protein